jgi:anti-anti-sigma factor
MAGANRLSIAVRLDDSAVVAQITGELDMATGSLLRENLQPFAGRTSRVVYELGDVSFIDSAGLESLFNAVDGEAVFIRRPSHAVRRVLQLLELETAIEEPRSD